MSKYCNIPVKKETKEKLVKLGYKSETWDELINRLIEAAVSPAKVGEDSRLNPAQEAKATALSILIFRVHHCKSHFMKNKSENKSGFQSSFLEYIIVSREQG
ncbi:MAG: DUF7557 family protein [Nitrososphaeria archaeon]